MKPSALSPDIHALIETKDFVTLKNALTGMEMHDLGELLSELEEDDLGVVFRLLPREQAADIFGDLPIERQEELLQQLSTERVAAILNDMPPDERTFLLEELPGQVAQRLLTSLRGDQLSIARSLLAYPEDSIGRLMTPQYVAVRPTWTIAQVLEHIRRVGPTRETLNILYVVDGTWHLLDDVTLEQIVLAEPDQTVNDLMDFQFAALSANESQETAVELLGKYDAVALPVVNSQGVLVGIVTFDDVMDVAEEEASEDFHKMVAVEALESRYFDTPFVQMIRKRLPWLVMLLAAEVLTVVALNAFETRMAATALFALLVVFVPLINSPAGNAGSQMAGLIIRGLAVREMEGGDWRRVLGRELGIGAILGGVLAVCGWPIALMFGRPYGVAVAVSLAIMLAVAFANLIGAMLPFIFKRLGFDPAVTSGPFIASVMDVMAIVIYFGIALGVLALLG